jgi:hypothetical protein
LGHNSSSFYSGYEIGSSFFCLAGLELWSSYIAWNNRYVPLSPAIGWDGVSQTIWPGWSWSVLPLISASQVARVIGMSHGNLDKISLICSPL